MPSPLFKFVGLLIAVCALSACGTIDDMFKSGSDGDHIVVTNNTAPLPEPNAAQERPAMPGTGPAPAPGQPYAGNFDPNNLMSVYNQISRGGVQLYDPSQGTSIGGGHMYAGGVPAPQDSRVTIFPIEGGYLSDIQQGYSAGSGAVSPYVNTGYTAGYRPGNSQIFFKHGSFRLGSGDERVLAEVAEQAKFSPVDRISIEGHASRRAETGDPVMDRVVNLKMSMDRTYAVSRSLMQKGVPAEKIKAISWGDTHQPENMPEDQARRVDIYTGVTP